MTSEFVILLITQPTPPAAGCLIIFERPVVSNTCPGACLYGLKRLTATSAKNRSGHSETSARSRQRRAPGQRGWLGPTPRSGQLAGAIRSFSAISRQAATDG